MNNLKIMSSLLFVIFILLTSLVTQYFLLLLPYHSCNADLISLNDKVRIILSAETETVVSEIKSDLP